MMEMMDIILSAFQESKENGSYILFYFLALGLGFAVAWDRYGKTELEDNWMVEEAKKQIQLWPFLYGLLALVFVVMSPVTIWIFNKVTPIGGQYFKILGLLLFLFICAYGMVCFLSILREKRQCRFLVLGFVILIGLAGTSYGLMSESSKKIDYKQEEAVVKYIKREAREDAYILAANSLVEYIGVYKPGIKILYGKDLYTANLDLGIMDSYPEELLQLYEAMQSPKGNMGEISKMAYMYDCEVIVVNRFENAPDKAGVYYKKEETENYILYMR